MTQQGPPGADEIFGRRGAPPKAKTDPPPPDPPAAPIAPADLTANIVIVYPDVTQPRRAIPYAARIHWDGNPQSTISLFDGWFAEASVESGQPVDALKETYLRIINRQLAELPDEGIKPIERALLRAVKLAASIANDGLEYPIIVTPRDEQTYLIGDGERRWLGFHLLYYLTRDERWLYIPIKIDEQFDRFDQATSNVNREDLNMVARARQYALLMMELLAGRKRFTAYNYFANDRDYYAQVVDLDAPDGSMQKLLNGCGVTNRASLSVYRQVLALPQEQWQIADEEDWGIRQIRALLNALNNAKKSSKSSPKTTAKPLPVIQKRTDFQKQFDRDWKRPERREALAKELDELAAWIEEKRNALNS